MALYNCQNAAAGASDNTVAGCASADSANASCICAQEDNCVAGGVSHDLLLLVAIVLLLIVLLN